MTITARQQVDSMLCSLEIMWHFGIAVVMWPHHAIELLFFAIFGQTTHDHFSANDSNQPKWTQTFFKIAFGVYMLVSVVVLINLLIAMMSDTYQRIQAQSDIEWKYGLSKLIRNMHRCKCVIV